MNRIRSRPKKGEHQKASATEAVHEILTKLGFDPAVYGVFDVWDKESASIAKGCKAVALQGHTLVVEVPSMVHRQELMYTKQRILKRVNQVIKRNFITDIKFEFKQTRGGFNGQHQIHRQRNSRPGESRG